MKLRNARNTLIVIEHNLEVIKCADWIIDLGPEGGSGGGEIVAQGTPEQVAQTPQSHTGHYLKNISNHEECDFFFLTSLMVLSAEDHLEAARAALDSGFPKVALLKIEAAMPMIGNADAGDQANLLYARALIADGQSEAAVKLLGAMSANVGLMKEFWLAQAFAANGASAEALEKYTNCAMAADFLFFREAVLGRASMLRNLNRLAEAVTVLADTTSWPSSPEKIRRFWILRSCIL